MRKYINKINLIVLASLCVFITACNEDETIEREGKPTVTISNNSIQLVETQSASLDFNFSYQIKENAQVRIEVVGGTAEEGTDYDFNLITIEDAGFGYFGGEGYFGEIPAFVSNYTLEDFLTVYSDSVDDASETIELKISSVSKGTILINENVTITIDNCSINNSKFVGDYLIEQISPELDGPTLSDGEVVTLSLAGASSRVFDTDNFPLYCSNTPNPFTITFDCSTSTVDIPLQDNVCACVDGTNYFGPATTPTNVDLNDDSVFVVTFTDDVQSDCGAPAQTSYRFTKQ